MNQWWVSTQIKLTLLWRCFAWPLCVLLAVVFAAMRLGGSKGEAYQAFVHLFVGGLFGAWLGGDGNRAPLWLALALSAVELFAFFVGVLA